MLLPEGQDLTETEGQPKITFTGNEEVEEDNTVGESTKPEVTLFGPCNLFLTTSVNFKAEPSGRFGVLGIFGHPKVL